MKCMTHKLYNHQKCLDESDEETLSTFSSVISYKDSVLNLSVDNGDIRDNTSNKNASVKQPPEVDTSFSNTNQPPPPLPSLSSLFKVKSRLENLRLNIR